VLCNTTVRWWVWGLAEEGGRKHAGVQPRGASRPGRTGRHGGPRTAPLRRVLRPVTVAAKPIRLQLCCTLFGVKAALVSTMAAAHTHQEAAQVGWPEVLGTQELQEKVRIGLCVRIRCAALLPTRY